MAKTHQLYLLLQHFVLQAVPVVAQAAHGGDTNVRLYWNTSQARDVFYARYIDWFITTPLLLLDLLLLSAVPVSTVLWCATCLPQRSVAGLLIDTCTAPGASN